MVGIINYIGNIGSIKNTLNYLEIPNFIANKPSDLEKATHIIIPGVGNWTEGVKRLKPFYKYLKTTKKPILGICLGMQLLCTDSEEGKGKGLDIFQFTVKKLPSQHVGWNKVGEDTFYFTHGYAVFGGNEPISIIAKEGVTGVQFHPEKSQRDGLQFLKDWWTKNQICDTMPI